MVMPIKSLGVNLDVSPASLCQPMPLLTSSDISLPWYYIEHGWCRQLWLHYWWWFCWLGLQSWCFWFPAGLALCLWQSTLLVTTSRLPLISSFISGDHPTMISLQKLIRLHDNPRLSLDICEKSPFLSHPFHQAGNCDKLISSSSPRKCNLSIVAELVTFHIFFDIIHLPATIPDFHQVLYRFDKIGKCPITNSESKPSPN